MRENLHEFFNPRTIAVVGASENKAKVGGILMKRLREFKGEVVPVSVSHDSIFGMKAYRNLNEFSGKIDLVVIAIPSKFVNSVLRVCGEKGIKNVIVISAGFSEVGNNELEKELVGVGDKYGMNVLGPNCFGITNPYLNLDLTFSNLSAVEGEIAFISQSGALWSYIADVSSSEKFLGFSAYVSLGNMGDLEFADFIEHFNEDERTKKIVLYIEKLKDGRRFIEVCKKSDKEIVVVKSGKTQVGSDATVSHTGSLATDFEIYKGVFKQAGVKVGESFASIFGIEKEELEISGKKIAIVTNAGGAGALLADYLSERGNDVSAPIDVIGTALAKDYENALENLKDSDRDLIFVVLTPQSMSQAEETANVVVKYSKFKKMIGMFLGRDSVKVAKEILDKNGIQCVLNL